MTWRRGRAPSDAPPPLYNIHTSQRTQRHVASRCPSLFRGRREGGRGEGSQRSPPRRGPLEEAALARTRLAARRRQCHGAVGTRMEKDTGHPTAKPSSLTRTKVTPGCRPHVRLRPIPVNDLLNKNKKEKKITHTHHDGKTTLTLPSGGWPRARACRVRSLQCPSRRCPGHVTAVKSPTCMITST